MDSPAKLRTCLWFYTQGEEAARFYVSLLPDSRIERVVRPDADAPARLVEFRLAGVPYMVLNGGPHLRLTEAVSISVLTENQAETDRLWDALLEDGGIPGRCGWLQDRFGLSWQVVPAGLPQLLASADRPAVGRVTQAMMEMGKLEIVRLEAAFADRA
ncbi:VOC family protein [Limimaricola pyoseonensis]|uniref:Glyoxalase superfamily enzyme, possibly 3-demethylubiquinone-9 3-methyltransferase n=1 Tax=Limimaricola pyoseonensis TaxID=521013 RepID=A0A1G6ZH20_9RHOB|nr:VOC family protein [Limimaricola pyoseonensis]SDE01880.1 Glyoxalase superfamily enzyme, possibly 3-demethylubiquinone-9 3-methyltransferase [Limimaricola pyoseonensis]